jgi:hypothetical protein
MDKFDEHHRTFEHGTVRITINRFIDLRWGRDTEYLKAWNPSEEAYEEFSARRQQDEAAANFAVDEYITSVELKELLQMP